MKISNIQQAISQPLSALKSLGLGAPSSSGTSSSSGSGSASGLVEILTGATNSISVPAAGGQAFAALKNLLKSAGSISAANTIQSDFARLATALSGNSGNAGAGRPGAYQEQSNLAANANSASRGSVSLVG